MHHPAPWMWHEYLFLIRYATVQRRHLTIVYTTVISLPLSLLPLYQHLYNWYLHERHNQRYRETNGEYTITINNAKHHAIRDACMKILFKQNNYIYVSLNFNITMLRYTYILMLNCNTIYIQFYMYDFIQIIIFIWFSHYWK